MWNIVNVNDIHKYSLTTQITFISNFVNIFVVWILGKKRDYKIDWFVKGKESDGHLFSLYVAMPKKILDFNPLQNHFNLLLIRNVFDWNYAFSDRKCAAIPITLPHTFKVWNTFWALHVWLFCHHCNKSLHGNYQLSYIRLIARLGGNEQIRSCLSK